MPPSEVGGWTREREEPDSEAEAETGMAPWSHDGARGLEEVLKEVEALVNGWRAWRA